MGVSLDNSSKCFSFFVVDKASNRTGTLALPTGSCYKLLKGDIIAILMIQ